MVSNGNEYLIDKTTEFFMYFVIVTTLTNIYQTFLFIFKNYYKFIVENIRNVEFISHFCYSLYFNGKIQ